MLRREPSRTNKAVFNRTRRRVALASVACGVVLLLAGAWSCVTDVEHNLGPFALSRELSLRLHRGVVAIRQITGYEQPVTLADWQNIDPVAHPERISPRQPSFPWFGYSSDRQTAMAEARPQHLELADDALVMPANIRVVFFPIWLPAILFCAPLFGIRRVRRADPKPRPQPPIAGARIPARKLAATGRTGFSVRSSANAER
jgi:hypothetical protein